MTDEQRERIDVLEQRLHELKSALPWTYKTYDPIARLSGPPDHRLHALMIEDPCGVWVQEKHLLAAADRITALEAENAELRRRLDDIRSISREETDLGEYARLVDAALQADGEGEG